ncbi:hypothetical protein EV121DRAFT_297498 [Schizophyllum commune]
MALAVVLVLVLAPVPDRADASAFVKTAGQWVGSKQQQRTAAGLATELSSLPTSITEDVTLMVNFLKGELENQRKVAAEMSLVELYHRCKLARSTRVGAQVVEMASIIHFTIRCSCLEQKYRSVKSKHMPFTVLFYEFLDGRNITDKKERKAEMRKVRDLYLYGKKLVQMANAGSFYFLILLAIKGLTTLRGMSESEVGSFANHLRSPIRAYVPSKDTTDSESVARAIDVAVVERIIPSIAYIRSRVALSFPTLLTAEEQSSIGVASTVRCDNLINSDLYFGAMPIEATWQPLPRCLTAWTQFSHPLSEEVAADVVDLDFVCLREIGSHALPPSVTIPDEANSGTYILHPHESVFLSQKTSGDFPCSEPDLDGCDVIDTAFNINAPANTRLPFRRFKSKLAMEAAREQGHTPEQCDKIGKRLKQRKHNARWRWTVTEREKVKHATQCATIDDFSKALEANFDDVKSGVRDTRSPYVRLPDSDKPTLVRCSDKSTLAFKTQAPKMMADTFEGSIDLAMSKSKLNKFSHRESFFKSYLAATSFHCSWYNRSHADGSGAPTDAHPYTCEAADGKRTNYVQFNPYPSKELVDNQDVYEAICSSMQDVFEWMSGEIQQRLPHMYDELRMVADFVPRYNDAGDPFTGFVININVSTLGHRDGKDYRGCALLIIENKNHWIGNAFA